MSNETLYTVLWSDELAELESYLLYFSQPTQIFLALQRECEFDFTKKKNLQSEVTRLLASSCIIRQRQAYMRTLTRLIDGFGRAIAQAVSCRFPTAVARVQTRVWSCAILWWTKVAVGQVFSENFGFPCQSTFHLLLHNHLHYHPRRVLYSNDIRTYTLLENADWRLARILQHC
jgi:hypothetical protein